ncbi:MAG TPA: DUF1707 domain-containing protein [Streptosporangiaceae bacterium]|jgi:hypothetical protein|nr:DUF1707 domain-containing protein [Streptosporangiaceae bacterium]
MTTDGGIRASDHDRESTVEVLREAYTAGRLDLDEFDERTTAAYAAKTWGDLRGLTADLPAEPKLGADLQPSLPKPDSMAPAARPQSYRPPFVPLLPIALVWLVIAAAAHTSAVIIPIVMLCLVSVRLFGWRRRRPPDPKPPQSSLRLRMVNNNRRAG